MKARTLSESKAIKFARLTKMGKTMTQHRCKRKDSKKPKRRSNSYLNVVELDTFPMVQDFQVRHLISPIEPRSQSQQDYLQSIDNNQLTFATGPAGTGKTWVCAAKAAEALLDKTVKKIVITRPVVEAEENMGFLPGCIEEKFAPYFTPFREVLEERLGAGHVKALLKAGRIEMAPLAYMRGRSFKECFVVLDEAQNTSEGQMKLFLTRIGENSKIVINGDISQKDIKVASGLTDAVNRFSHFANIGYVHFEQQDIIRSGLVQKIVEGYESPPHFKPPVMCA